MSITLCALNWVQQEPPTARHLLSRRPRDETRHVFRYWFLMNHGPQKGKSLCSLDTAPQRVPPQPRCGANDAMALDGGLCRVAARDGPWLVGAGPAIAHTQTHR